MRVRRSGHAQDLRQAPIDGIDAFILTRLVDTLTIDDLIELAPCEPADAMRRIAGLAELGLLELLDGRADVLPPGRPRRAFEPPEDAVTLRPPPPQDIEYREPATLWPTKQAPLRLDMNGFADPPQTGVRMRPEPCGQALAQVRMMRRKA